MKYIIDTSSLITPHRNYYNIEIAPSFWDKLLRIVNDHRQNVFFIDKVKSEILEGNDFLVNWINRVNHQKILQTKTDIQVLKEYRNISSWVRNHSQYKEIAKQQFLKPKKADAFLISYAKAYIHEKVIIVTEERPSPDGNLNKRKIQIPDVCKEFDIQYIHLFDFMRKFKISL